MAQLEVISKSIDLMKYTYTVTGNHKRYPRKYLILVQEIQQKCMEVYKELMYANRLQLGTSEEKEERIKSQTKALSCFIQISYELNLIGSNTLEFWQKQISDIKYMTIAWRSKDKKR